jgi:hypothetical protein
MMAWVTKFAYGSERVNGNCSSHSYFHIQTFPPWFKELNPRRRVNVEIPKPTRVELK